MVFCEKVKGISESGGQFKITLPRTPMTVSPQKSNVLPSAFYLGQQQQHRIP